MKETENAWIISLSLTILVWVILITIAKEQGFENTIVYIDFLAALLVPVIIFKPLLVKLVKRKSNA